MLGGMMAAADLVKFRDTGELSDITIVVNGDDCKLHKFPLYIKSNFFKECAQESGSDKVELSDFPGGMPIFSLIADFCYNKRIDISLDNVAAIRSGAEFLKMEGQGNLIDLSERYLNDVLTSAKMSRSMAPIVELLVQCSSLGEAADNAKIAEKCFETILDIWIRPMSRYSRYGTDSLVTDKLLRLPLNWFVRLVKTCGENEMRLRPMAELVYHYLDRVFCRELKKENSGEKKPKTEKKEKEVVPEKEADADEQEHEEDAEDSKKKPEKEEEDETEAIGSDTEADVKKKDVEESGTVDHSDAEPTEPAGEVLDTVIQELPEETPLHEFITVEWVRQAIEIADKYSCECRERLLKLAGNILHRFNNEELKEIPSNVLCEIIENTVRNEKAVPEVISTVIDTYLSDLAKRGQLSVDDFIRLVKSVPSDYRVNHDALFDVMEILLTSGETIPDEKQLELLEIVDLSKCNDSTLQRALDKNLVPAKELCQAAINLAKRLREESEASPSYKYTSSSDTILPRATQAYQSSYSTRYGMSGESGTLYTPSVTIGEPVEFSSTYYAPPATYGRAAPSYEYQRAGNLDGADPGLIGFEDTLRAELNRISTTYEQYFRERSRERERERVNRARRRSPYSAARERRW